jgi:predicted 2-oxoglutarate/Fe(II)-dependent dioxygenase YbiX
MTKDYIIIDNFIDLCDIDNIRNKLNENDARQGKYGDHVRIDKKNRYEYSVNENNILFVDEQLEKYKNELYKSFNSYPSYREKWKIAHYKGDHKGFYTEHRDNQCRISHRKISAICMLSDPSEYEGGELYFPELDKSFILKKGSVIFFNPNLLHGVKEVINGERFIILSFLFDVEFSHLRNNFKHSSYDNRFLTRKYLLPLTPDSGPGNQIITIKECMLLSKLLNRISILPPIISHYTNVNKQVWNFNEIFQVNDNLFEYYDVNKEYNFQNIYGFSRKYTMENLKIEKQLNINNKNLILLNKKSIRTVDDIEELKSKDDNILCVKHSFNHVHFNECSVNGCSQCGYNQEFLQLYKEICMLLDYSEKIKVLGDLFIKEKLHDNYISIHIRYPDHMSNNQTLKNFIDYDEEQIYNVLEKLKQEKNLNYVFIATNKQAILKKSSLKNYVMYDINDDAINSFIEQYICCCSNTYIMSKYNDYRKKDDYHLRSTWSSFVLEYRIFKNKNKNNIYLQELL